MKVMIVDDERLALRSMERLLQQVGGVHIVGAYQNPQQALDAVRDDGPELVFLDIEMPTMSGIELAERLQNVNQELQIVFVTAFNEYAITAFELQALDYLVKPVRPDRLVKTMERMHKYLKQPEKLEAPRSDATTMIRMFDSLQVQYPNEQPTSISWRTQKSQELFAYLLFLNGKIVRKDALIEILWPDQDADKAYTNLYTTVYQLRRTLKQQQIGVQILSLDEGYYIEKGEVTVDVELWENAVLSTPELSEETAENYQYLLQLYRGHYLDSNNYAWAKNRRDQLAMQWFYFAVRVGEYLIEHYRYAEAIPLCTQVCSYHPAEAQGYYMLMNIYAELGEEAAVEQQYARYTEALKGSGDFVTEPTITEWYVAWRQSRGA